MRLIVSLLAIMISVFGTTGSAPAGWFGAARPLAVIDGQEYTADDYLQWWELWRDSETQQPEGVMPFVEWHLLVREAERMELATLPEFQHKIRVFLAARTLMALKQEEIDAKVVISEQELKSTYERDYVPMRLVGVLEFSDIARARAFYEQFGRQPLTGARLQQMAEATPSPFIRQHPQWLRPHNTPAPWLPLLTKAVAGTLLSPLPLAEKTAILLHVAEVKEGDPVDFAKKRDALRNQLRKRQEEQLTDRLIRDLINKYHVRIDEGVLKAIDLADPGNNDPQKVVIDSDRSTVTVAYFLDQCRKEAEVSRKPRGDGEAQQRLKRQFANAMIANSVVSWEASARHYEERPPLQRIYQFYRQNRLAVELERRAVGEQQVTEAEALAYYQGHQGEFQHPELVRVVVINGEERAVRQVWTEAISGKDLIKAAQGHKVPVTTESSAAVPVQHLSAQAQEAVVGLKPGELSQPYAEQGQYGVVRLEERQAGGVAPFAQVEKAVKEKVVREKRALSKQELIATLKSRSRITVNDEVWAALAAKYKNGK
jgi:hypothetical protein